MRIEDTQKTEAADCPRGRRQRGPWLPRELYECSISRAEELPLWVQPTSQENLNGTPNNMDFILKVPKIKSLNERNNSIVHDKEILWFSS